MELDKYLFRAHSASATSFKLSIYRKAIVSPAITMLTIDMSLMRIFSEGPEVS